LRCYIVYGSNAVFGILLLWIMLDELNWNIWISQIITLAISVVASFIFHKRFTFK